VQPAEQGGEGRYPSAAGPWCVSSWCRGRRATTRHVPHRWVLPLCHLTPHSARGQKSAFAAPKFGVRRFDAAFVSLFARRNEARKTKAASKRRTPNGAMPLAAAGGNPDNLCGSAPFSPRFAMIGRSKVVLPLLMVALAVPPWTVSPVTAGDARPRSPAKKTVVDTAFRSEGVCVVDVNKDGRPDIFTGGLLVRGPKGKRRKWARHIVRADRRSTTPRTTANPSAFRRRLQRRRLRRRHRLSRSQACRATGNEEPRPPAAASGKRTC